MWNYLNIFLFNFCLINLFETFQDWLYWTDWESESIYKVDKFTGKNVQTVASGVYSPMGVRVYHSYKQPTGNEIFYSEIIYYYYKLLLFFIDFFYFFSKLCPFCLSFITCIDIQLIRNKYYCTPQTTTNIDAGITCSIHYFRIHFLLCTKGTVNKHTKHKNLTIFF